MTSELFSGVFPTTAVGAMCDADAVTASGTRLGSRSSRSSSWSSLRTTVIGDLLGDAVRDMGPVPLRIIDAGGGTGGFAVPFAIAGHQVTVVDPSPDAMAALRRRADEQPMTGSVTAVQGDLAGLLDVVAPGQADLVLCHNVLEVVDLPAEALVAVRDALRPDGWVSLLVTGRGGAVLARALAGRPREARDLLDDTARHRHVSGGFTPEEITTLLSAAGFVVDRMHAIRVFSDHVPATAVDGDPTALTALLDP